MTRLMYDSVTAGDIPADAALAACYVDGPYRNEAQVRARCPHARVVTITVRGGGQAADVVDCETYDVTPPHAAAWAKRQIQAGRHPTIYCNSSTWPTVKAEVAKLGISAHVSYWIAHYDDDPTIPAGAVAKQYRSDNTVDLDTSSVADYWPGIDPAPSPTPRPGPVPLKETDMLIIRAANEPTCLLAPDGALTALQAGEPDVYVALGVQEKTITTAQLKVLQAVDARVR